MKRRLLLAIALLLLIAAWTAGCSGRPAATIPPAEPTTVQPQSAETRVAPETVNQGTSLPVPTPESQREEATMTPAPLPQATEAESPAKAGPLAETEPSDEAKQVIISPRGDDMPIFVEMTKTIMLASPAPQRPLPETGRNDVFVFDAASQTLLVRPSITIDPATTVLMGVTTVIQSANQTSIRGELFQSPSTEAAPLAVVALEPETGTLVLAYSGQTFELAAGESRSFKQAGPGQAATTEVTIITNHGQLSAISPFPPDWSVR